MRYGPRLPPSSPPSNPVLGVPQCSAIGCSSKPFCISPVPGCGVQPLSPLGTAWALAPTVGAAPDGRLAPDTPPLDRCDDCPRPSTRRRRVKKNGGHAAQALGRSRGGLSTKLHAGCRDERPGVALGLTAGHCHESPGFEMVLAQVPP